jgi:hypothetical protein
LADSLLAAETGNPSYWGWVGALAARGGDRAGAQQADRWLAAFDDPYTRRDAILWRARIQAQLGETESAIGLLREAYTAGVNFNAIDGEPVYNFFLIIAPPLEVSNQYLPVLGKIAQFAKEPDVPQRLAALAEPRDLLTLLADKNI